MINGTHLMKSNILRDALKKQEYIHSVVNLRLNEAF